MHVYSTSAKIVLNKIFYTNRALFLVIVISVYIASSSLSRDRKMKMKKSNQRLVYTHLLMYVMGLGAHHRYLKKKNFSILAVLRGSV